MHARGVYSQYGEDGILEALFSALGIESGYCIEFGADDGLRGSNTFSLVSRGWGGLMIEPASNAFCELQHTMKDRANIACRQSFVTLQGPTTLDALLDDAGAPADPDLLSIDVDGLDYHIWRSLQRYSPKVVVIEFNPSIPNHLEFVQAPRETVVQGSSIRSLTLLAQERGYELVAVTENNGIFVREDLFGNLDLTDNSLDDLRDDGATTTVLIQGYDGALALAGNQRLLWHDLPLHARRIQVIPSPLRHYPPRLSTFRRIAFHAWSLLYLRRTPGPDRARHASSLWTLIRHVPRYLSRMSSDWFSRWPSGASRVKLRGRPASFTRSQTPEEP